MNPTRRTVALAGAWSVPVILTASAAPAAAASANPGPIPTCIPTDVLLVTPKPGQSFKTNQGQGNTLVKGDGVVVTNTGATPLSFVVGFWTNAGQVGVLSILGNDTVTMTAPKDGNHAATTLLLLPGPSRTLEVATRFSDAEAHLVIDCQTFLFRSVGAA